MTEKPRRVITVVCACIRRHGGREVLLSVRRAPGVAGLDGKWELPGGKIEFGETPEEAVVREIHEEIGVRVAPLRLLPYLHTNCWEYEHVSQQVVLACFECDLIGGELRTLGDDVRWFAISEIDFSSTLPGTREFVQLVANNELLGNIYIRFEHVDVEARRLKQFCLSTHPTFFSSFGLVKYWGRVGQAARSGIEEFGSARALDARLLAIVKRRLAHGYRIVELQGPARQYEVL